MLKLVCLLLYGTPLFGQQLSHSLDSLMRKNFTQHEPGAALLIAKNGTIIYAKGFGVTDIEADKQQPVSLATNFRMASVSKQFTAMCIVLLEQQHKISYNDKLLKFFPKWNKKVASTISVKQLLTHSSGIWDYEELIPEHQQEQVLDEDIVRYLQLKDSLYFEPGTAFRYSNSGYCVLEQIVEKLSGISYPAFCNKYLFKPAGMKLSTIYERGKTIDNRAMGFAKDSSGNIFPSDQSITSASKGDGGVYTSLNDYFKWASWLITNPNYVATHLRLVNRTINASAYKYGLGWFNFNDSIAGVTLYHTGSTCGFSSVVKIIPGYKLVVAYFSNIADNHATYYEVEAILKRYKIDPSQTATNQLIDLTR